MWPLTVVSLRLVIHSPVKLMTMSTPTAVEPDSASVTNHTRGRHVYTDRVSTLFRDETEVSTNNNIPLMNSKASYGARLYPNSGGGDILWIG